MTNEERAVRIAAAMEHHITYGMERDEDQLRAFLNDTAAIPLGLFLRGLKLSRQMHEGNFPPPQGKVVSAARMIHWRELPPAERPPSNEFHPSWYKRMLRGNSSERPVMIGGRTGQMATLAEASSNPNPER